MADTPDENDPTEPFSPSIFLDLPPTPCREDGGDDPAPASSSSGNLVLPFISRMLMEDEEEDMMNDSLFYPDHPALLQAQQPFAEILSDVSAVAVAPSSSDANTGGGQLAGEEGTRAAAMPRPADGGDLQEESLVASAMFKQAFLKGEEEAKRFLPTIITNNLCTSGEHQQVKKPDAASKNRREADEPVVAACSRNSKMVLVSSEQDDIDGEKVDRMFLTELNTCLDNIKRLSITTTASGGETATAQGKKKKKDTRSRRRPAPAEADEGAPPGDLHALLIHCAQAMGTNDRRAAAELLRQIKKQSSPRGDPNQRLAHCFAEGLEARLAGTGAQVYRSVVSKRTSPVEYLKAYQLYLDSCCFKMTSFTFSNRSILDAITAAATAAEKKTKKVVKVHIVDYGIDYGLQWATMLTHFAPMDAAARPHVRITGIDHPQPGFRPSSRLDETGRRLGACARHLGVPFAFRGIASARWETVGADDLDIDPDELLVVNSLGPFGNLRDEGVDVDSTSPRDAVLANVRRLRPDLFVLCVVNGSYSSPFFVRRFREALSYYTALFDMLDATIPRRDDGQRLLVERDLYGRGVLNVVACEGCDRVERPEAYRQWQLRCRRAGLTQLPLDPETFRFVREKISSLYHKDFVIDRDQHWLLKGWKGRILYAISTWVAADHQQASSSKAPAS